VAVGRLEPQKDHDTLLRAFAHARAGGLEASLVVVGDGSRRSALESLAAELGVERHVHFTGFVDDPYPWMGSATAVVLSSRYEGSPNVLLEALALGVRCVSTDCPHGPAEILTDDRLGSLVPVGDPVALAGALVAAAAAAGEEGAADAEHRVAHVRAHHDLAAVARAYAEALLGRPLGAGAVG
jgi:glycosyltransferase involved in cell wall biosynthesis